MRNGRARVVAVIGAVGITVGGSVWLAHRDVEAADHFDPPDRLATAPTSADIGDFYAWHTAAGKTVFVLTFDGAQAPTAGQAGRYDRDVLYRIHVDNDADAVADIVMNVRFGQNPADGAWGVQVEGLPGAATAIGPVETTIDGGGGVFVYAGLKDDPFFFDLDGFRDTLTTGDLAFCSVDPACPGGMAPRDSLAGTNATAVVIEVNTADLLMDGSTRFQTWATTGRISG